jgi:hypothetical protein
MQGRCSYTPSYQLSPLKKRERKIETRYAKQGREREKESVVPCSRNKECINLVPNLHGLRNIQTVKLISEVGHLCPSYEWSCNAVSICVLWDIWILVSTNLLNTMPIKQIMIEWSAFSCNKTILKGKDRYWLLLQNKRDIWLRYE